MISFAENHLGHNDNNVMGKISEEEKIWDQMYPLVLKYIKVITTSTSILGVIVHG